ncbi:MAG TPA: hypothetical protein VFX02_02790 [Gammaproteobacteria bacterium]|nr:hypothetical protein [Gammaproteobacteria bacterium]
MSESNDGFEDERAAEIDPGLFGVTPESFREWRFPRVGNSNPEKVESKVWEWLVRSRLDGFRATEKMNGPSPMQAGPTWSFDRFGRTSTRLPDGRTIFVAGEHEDHYDPDFHIYNDVVVLTAGDSIEFYCYPKSVFPPTDFHTATPVDGNIVIVGNLGYPEQRREQTQVLLLDTATYEVSEVTTSGPSPGWIHEHKAELSADRRFIILSGGKLDSGPGIPLRENIDDWRLSLNDWRWERLTERRWVRWELRRKDRKFNHLWYIRQALFNYEMKWEEEYKKSMEDLSARTGHTPDARLIRNIYSPAMAHEKLPEADGEYNVYRIRVDGVVVRFVEESHCIQVTVEGELPQSTSEVIRQDTLAKVSALDNAEYEVESY